MYHQLAHVVRQAGPAAAAKLRVLYKGPGFIAQLLTEAFGPPRIVLADIGHDGAQILARISSSWILSRVRLGKLVRFCSWLL
jgi:hypothetical protein